MPEPLYDPEPLPTQSSFGGYVEQPKESEKNEYYEKYLRARADFENYQKRARFEAERAREETTRKMLLELLPIWDNFELIANQEIPGLDRNIFGSVKNQFLQFFENQEIKLLDVKVGDSFNSEFHEVILFQEAQVEIPTIVDIFRSGFCLNNKVIRAAQVKIATPPKI
jgi:molecular chaperone GrpE